MFNLKPLPKICKTNAGMYKTQNFTWAYAEMSQQWPPGSDPEEAQGTLMTLLP
jgi:hypothetical protein